MRTSAVTLVKVVACVISAILVRVQQLFTFELHVLVGCRERVARDVTDPRVFHSWPHAVCQIGAPGSRI
jgi:hypothetical protein